MERSWAKITTADMESSSFRWELSTAKDTKRSRAASGATAEELTGHKPDDLCQRRHDGQIVRRHRLVAPQRHGTPASQHPQVPMSAVKWVIQVRIGLYGGQVTVDSPRH